MSAECNCVEDLKELYKAYRDVSMGRQYKRVESSDMGRVSVVEYAKPDLPMIAQMYNDLYKRCGAEAGSCYPAVLSVTANIGSSATQRGKPTKAWFA